MTIHDTPIGPVRLAASGSGITLVAPAGAGQAPAAADGGELISNARRELDAYFAGKLREFTVPVDLTAVNKHDGRILNGLESVTFGQTVSYGELAKRVGMTVGDARRVGGAMARNPVLIIVPCHRVVGTDGALVGYAGGLPAKRLLLDLEAAAERPLLDLDFG